MLKSICVFCGSRAGVRNDFAAAAEQLGRLLGQLNLELVYGGGNIGLMGIVADAAMTAGSHVVGVIPESLVGREIEGRSVAHPGLSRLEIVDSMHTRKARMAALADGFIALPGGFGTFEELFEILTWAQLGFHDKPVGILNIADYYAPLLALCDQAVSEGFLSPASRSLLLAKTTPEDLLTALFEYTPKPGPVWVSQEAQL